MTAAAPRTPDPFLGDAYFADPPAVIAEMRATDPVHYIEELDLWMATRYDDVRVLFTHPSVTNDRRAFKGYLAPPEGTYLRWLSDHNFFSAPPDEHARLRRLVSGTLTPRGVQRMEGQIRDVVADFTAPLRGRTGVVDLFAEYTDPIPNTVISRITGIPPRPNEEARFRELAREVIRGISPILDEEARKISENAIVELAEWVRELAKLRAETPQEDLVSDLLSEHAGEGAGAASVDEIVVVITGLVAAGSETTALGTTMGLRTLFRHPDQMTRLRDDRSRLPNAVRELLRYDFGTAALPRYALEDFELRGKKIRKGQPILLSFHGAHRDPEVFEDPDRFDIERDTRSLTIFGHGPHYCIGANLAQLEMGCMLEGILDVLPERAMLLEDEIDWQRLGAFSRAATLPVDFGG